MRIVGGTWRSRRLIRPVGAPTRPMPDRVREAIFAMLGSYYDHPGALPPLLVADVFCGSGSMGLEALSRGAASCQFFERDPLAVEALGRNLEQLGVTTGFGIIRGNAWQKATSLKNTMSAELIFLDPPYRDAEDTSSTGPVRRFLEKFAETHDHEHLVVLHHPRSVHFTLDDGGPHKIIDERAIGSNAISVFKR